MDGKGLEQYSQKNSRPDQKENQRQSAMTGQPQSRLKRWLRHWLFIPDGTCPVCGKILWTASGYLCADCFEHLSVIRMKDCRYCGRPVLSEENDCCEGCSREKTPCFSGGAVWLHYSGAARPLIAALKFGQKPILGEWIGEQLATVALEKDWAKIIDAVVPVPLHPARFDERGYNQSAFLARGIARILSVPVLEEGLIRQVNTPHQLGLDRDDRMKNLSGAFSVLEPASISGKRLLLIDDVITTGSTLKECAQTLLQAGAQAVYIAAAAAAPGN